MKSVLQKSLLRATSLFCLSLFAVDARDTEEAIEPLKQHCSLYAGIQGGPATYLGAYTAAAGTHTVFFEAGDNTTALGGCLGIDGRYGLFYGALEGNFYYNHLMQVIGVYADKVGVPDHIVRVKNYDLLKRLPCLWGGLAKFGFYCADDVAIYMLGGVTGGRWPIGLENDRAINFSRGIQPQSSMYFNETLWGSKLGLGIHAPFFFKRVYFDLQYSYSWYGNISVCLRDLDTNKVWRHTLENNQQLVLFSLNFSLYEF